MLSKMSKSDKTMFYYLGLSLLVLIVLGVVFGVSSVKESFDGNKTRREKYCYNEGVKEAKNNRKLWRSKEQLQDFTKDKLNTYCKRKFGSNNREAARLINKTNVSDYGKDVAQSAVAEWVGNNL